jgi:hypothetical protein
MKVDMHSCPPELLRHIHVHFYQSSVCMHSLCDVHLYYCCETMRQVCGASDFYSWCEDCWVLVRYGGKNDSRTYYWITVENKGSMLCPTNYPELALHTTLYVIFILLHCLFLYHLMIQNLNIHAFWDVTLCKLVNDQAVNLGLAVNWTTWLWLWSQCYPLIHK